MVRRDHIAASPDHRQGAGVVPDGRLELVRGNKAMEATPRGLFIGGDGMFQGGVRTGRVAFYDFNSGDVPGTAPDTTITHPVEGRVVDNNVVVRDHRDGTRRDGTVGRVQVQIQDRDSSQWLQDNGTAFTTLRAPATPSTRRWTPGTGTTRSWSLTVPATSLTIEPQPDDLRAGVPADRGTGDTTKATK